MKRIQVQLTEDQERRLRRRATTSGKSIAGAIREAVDRYVGEDDREARIQRALTAMNRFRSRDHATDVSVNHDKYLAEIYGRRKK
jgi:hypothetical protein